MEAKQIKTAMEKPIIFSPAMVEAIMSGRKTQTRRVIKPQPPGEGYELWTLMSTTGPRKNEGKLHWVKPDQERLNFIDDQYIFFTCPYGHIGDKLWVRERWAYIGDQNWQDASFDDWGNLWHYATAEQDARDQLKWKPSIHMPRRFARLILEVKDIRIEKLQDISESDAINEGIESQRGIYKDYLTEKFYRKPYQSFETLWCKINGQKSWQSNPWVWVVEFEKA